MGTIWKKKKQRRRKKKRKNKLDTDRPSHGRSWGDLAVRFIDSLSEMAAIPVLAD
jgi:hypothetical protein